jgi:hypothetical protein
MSKPKLHYTRGYLINNGGRLGTARTKPQIEPKDEPHANDCGCLTCHITGKVDDAIDRQLGSESDLVGNALPPPPGVLADNPQTDGERKRVNVNTAGPLLLPRGVFARGEA